jgi:hypothetical protein
MALVSSVMAGFEFIQKAAEKIKATPMDDVPQAIRDSEAEYSKINSLSSMAQILLSTRKPVLYRVKNRIKLMKSLPKNMTLNEVNENGMGFMSKMPAECVLLRYPRWANEESDSTEGMMILVSDSDDLVGCIDTVRVTESGYQVWTPLPPPMFISLGFTFSKRPDREVWAEKYFGDPHALDDHDHYILELRGEKDPIESSLEVFTLLGAFLYALNAQGSQTKKYRYEGDYYNMIVRDGKAV